MQKGMTIVYPVHSGLYINLTNKCSSACTFCLRQGDDKVGESDSLWLEREPTVEEATAAIEEKLKSFLAPGDRGSSGGEEGGGEE